MWHTETVRLLHQRVADLDAQHVQVGAGLGEIRTEVTLAAANVHVDGLRAREREVPFPVERSRQLEASLQRVDVRADVPLGAHALAPHRRGRARRRGEGNQDHSASRARAPRAVVAEQMVSFSVRRRRAAAGVYRSTLADKPERSACDASGSAWLELQLVPDRARCCGAGLLLLLLPSRLPESSSIPRQKLAARPLRRASEDPPQAMARARRRAKARASSPWSAPRDRTRAGGATTREERYPSRRALSAALFSTPTRVSAASATGHRIIRVVGERPRSFRDM